MNRYRSAFSFLLLALLTSHPLASPLRTAPIGELAAPDDSAHFFAAREDSSFYFAPTGEGSYGRVGTNERGYDFDSSEDCTPAGWLSHGYTATLGENDFLPGQNETCMWSFFDPTIVEPGYPMGVFPYGPPYLKMWIQSPILEVDQNGLPMEVVSGQSRLYLRYDIYEDLPLNSVVFHSIEFSARTETTGYQVWEIYEFSVFYGEDGWETNVIDLTEQAFSIVGGTDEPLAGLQVQLTIWDLCPDFCDIFGDGESHTMGILLDNVQLFSAPEPPTGLPPVAAQAATKLLPVAPNPFNPSTEIRFELGQAGKASLRICDMGGRVQRTLERGNLAAGSHTMEWDGRDDAGRPVASGVYLVQLETESGHWSRKAVLLK